ncbi:hypothetical protein AeNC1_006998 [Aphanomyces euteiches]|nr:hypothetical protein AeNC1_006998 [Aphanomyces euteiches]
MTSNDKTSLVTSLGTIKRPSSMSPTDEMLFEAVKDGNVRRVRALLRDGANVNAKDRTLNSPLYYALRHGQLYVAEELLANCALIDEANQSGVTALTCAIRNGNIDGVKLLLAHGATANIPGLDWKTPLVWAIVKKEWEILKELLDHGGTFMVDELAKHRQAAMHWASMSGRVDIVRLLSDYRVEVKPVDKNDNTPMYKALRNKHWAVVMELVAHGGLVDTKNQDGETSLHEASYIGDTDFVEFLLAHNATVNLRDDVSLP